MEDENISSSITSGNNNDTMKEEEEEEEDVPLPGFRFHPTDEELVGFYLRRKVENKKITLELIKHAEIYKHDPWDLPKLCNSAGDKEWYFYCKRGRKYKNSVRPNRVTSSGFWKATGIDKPVYSAKDGSSSADHNIIGLKKSLVYYRGSSGKGTKTDWMMHEFRLPPTRNSTDDQEAEVWTLCRVFKRNSTASNYCKRSSDSRQTGANNSKRLRSDVITNTTAASKTSISSHYSDDDHHHHHMNYISFNAPVMKPINDINSGGGYVHYYNFPANSSSSSLSSSDEITRLDPSLQDDHFNDMLGLSTDYDWAEDLRSLVSCDTVHANVVVHPSFYV